jgi:hypothetical protein
VLTLFNNLYRVLQRAVLRLAPEYRQTWNDRQKAISEALPFTYLERLLPGAKVYRPVYYRWRTGDGPAQWYEADGLLIYDDHLLVIEVKAGAFTNTSPATDLPAHIESLRNLLLSPTTQGNRFVDYLESGADVPIHNSDHEEIGRLRRADYRHVTVCAVTLDAFTELAARAQHLRKIGIDVGERSVWVLSIDDLRVYADLITNPLVFLHFIEQRMRAAQSDIVDLDDEVDHLGLYLLHNNYAQYAAELLGSETARLHLTGYRSAIDEYYAAIMRQEVPARPEQTIPKRLAEIVSHLSRTTKHGRSRIASFLLDGASDARTMIAQTVDRLLRDNAVLGRARPMSMHGEYCCTFWVWTPAVPRNPVIALQHTQTVVAALDERSRLMIEFEYSSDGDLLGVHWQDVDLYGLSAGQLARTRAAGASLRQERVARALARAKVGPNDPCPCGRGRKYKRCCRP